MSGTTGQINYFNSLVGREINRAYRIDEQLAVGGMGAVFRATQLSDSQRVAVKIISPHLAANNIFVKRFKREAKVGCLLSHPHIVKVYEYGETPEGLLFMVMEFVEGETLGYYLERFAPFNFNRCLEILKPLCQALDEAHRRNILHRDLKPANILITKDKNERESVKLVDFGLVKLLEPDQDITDDASNLTGVGEACGTPYYMSPEQIIGQPLGPPADVYSVGVMLFQMLTSKMPIESSSIRQILAMKINQDLPPPSQKYPQIPTVMDKVLQKSMARDPRNRYQSAGELFRAFQQMVTEITAEFSQPTEPALHKNFLDDVRKDASEPQIETSAIIASTISPTSTPLPPTPAVSPVDIPGQPSTPAPIRSEPVSTADLPSPLQQTKTLWIIIAILSLLLIVSIGLLLSRN
jgi:eukaryotic-like serine/threonine-protein kinase